MRSEGVEVGFIHREPSRAGRGLPEGPIDAWDGGARSLQECVRRQQPDWLWVQLSGYGYSRWGARCGLDARCGQLRRRLPDVGLAVFAHETHCQPHQLGRKGRLLSPWQRYTVGTVVRQADLVFTSIPKYLRQITHDYDFPSDRIVRLPIGSSIPPVYLTQTERRQRRKRLGWGSEELVAVTFGSFGSQLRACAVVGTAWHEDRPRGSFNGSSVSAVRALPPRS